MRVEHQPEDSNIVPTYEHHKQSTPSPVPYLWIIRRMFEWLQCLAEALCSWPVATPHPPAHSWTENRSRETAPITMTKVKTRQTVDCLFANIELNLLRVRCITRKVWFLKYFVGPLHLYFGMFSYYFYYCCYSHDHYR